MFDDDDVKPRFEKRRKAGGRKLITLGKTFL